MQEFVALVGILVLVFPFLYYWLHSRRAKNGLTELCQQGYAPDVVCEFLSMGHKVAFDTANRKVAFINVEFTQRSKNPLDGRSFSSHRLSEVFDYSSVEDVLVHRGLENGRLSKSGIVYVKFFSAPASDSYTQATLPVYPSRFSGD